MQIKAHWLALCLTVALPVLGPPVAAPPAAAQTALGAAEIDGLLRLLPQGVTVRHGAITTRGDTTVIETLTLTAGDVIVSVGRLSLTGIDLPGFVVVLAPPRPGTPRDENLRRLAARFDIESLKVTDKGETALEAARITLDDLSMRAFAQSVTDQRWRSHDEAIAAFQTAGLWLDALKVGRLQVEKIETSLTLNDGGLGQSLLLAADRLDFAGLDRGRFGTGTLTDYRINQIITSGTDPVSAIEQRLKATRFDGLDVSALVPFMLKGELPPPDAKPYITMGGWLYEGWTVDIMGVGTFDIPRAELGPVPFQWVLPARVDFTMTGSFSPAPASSFAGGPELRALFLDKAPFSIGTGWTFDFTAGTAELTRYGISLGGWGAVDAGVRFVDIDLKETRGPIEDMMAIAGARVRVRDEGGIDKALGLLAEDGVVPAPPALARRSIAEQIREIAGTPPFAGWPGLRQSAEAAIAFITAGGELTLAARPPLPLNEARRTEAERANDPEVLWRAWGVSATRAP